MNALTFRILSLMVRLFGRLDSPEREWLLARLAADHRAALLSETTEEGL